MKKDATATSPSVLWRLPSLNDWHQANINGVRFVIPRMTGFAQYAGTYPSGNRSAAWAIEGDGSGAFSTYTRNKNTAYFRCVGRYNE